MEQPTINVNAKNQLAKLLATENISIQYNPNATTASFDVKNRVLYMPVWKGISEDLHDMLNVHETGHAIDTPADGWENDMKAIARKYYNDDANKYLMAIKTFLNVVEDARIDKRQKRRYPGSRRNYLAGYKELLEKDFFGIKNKNVDGMSFIDRANIYFKGGNLLMNISFSPEERKYLKRMENAETWQQVVELADELFGLAKSKQEEQNNTTQNDMEYIVDEDGDVEMDAVSENGESDDAESLDEDSDDAESSDEDEAQNQGYGNQSSNEPAIPQSETDRQFEQNKQSMAFNSEYKFHYYGLPEIDYNDLVDDYPAFLADYENYFTANLSPEWFKTVCEELNKIKTEENNTISYMVKEFEMRKAADLYSRQSISKTGVINTNKLHSYKYNEDIFRRLSVLPQGKNHGFIMFLDWSGSMHTNLPFTMKQLFSLVLFCKRVQIPFEVYLFREARSYTQKNNFDPNKINFDGFKLRNILSSRMKNNDLNKAFNYLWALTKTHSIKDPMCSTPLNQTIYAATKLVNAFQAKNKLQVVNTIFLTDGDSNPSYFGNGTHNIYGSKNIKIVQDNITKKEYRFVNYSHYSHGYEVTTMMLQILKSRTNCNLLGFYLYGERNVNYVLARFFADDNLEYRNKIKEKWSDDKFIPVVNQGYDEYYVINTYNRNKEDTQLKVDSSMTKNKIAKEFMKFSQKKTINRILLNRFMEKVTKNH